MTRSNCSRLVFGRKLFTGHRLLRLPAVASVHGIIIRTVRRLRERHDRNIARNQDAPGADAIYAVTPLMFVSALVQYTSSNDSLSTNVRLRWECSPGSELFIVYNEDRDTDPFMPGRFPGLRNRAFVIKVNRLFQVLSLHGF